MNFSHQKQVHAQTLLLAGLGRNLLVAREDRNFLCGHQTTCSRDAEQRVLGTHDTMYRWVSLALQGPWWGEREDLLELPTHLDLVKI
jgi:hypothetical protein